MERKQRVVARLIRDAISDVIAREVRDPRVGIVSVSSVDLSADFRHAKIRLSVIGSTEDEMRESFDRARPFIRRMLGERVRLRHVPEIVFERDRGAEHAEHIARILAEIESDRSQEGEHESS